MGAISSSGFKTMSDSFFVYTKRNPFWLRQQRAIAEREPNLTYHGPQYRYHYYH